MVVEGAIMGLRVAMLHAEHVPALALGLQQAHLLGAEPADV